LLHSVLLLVLLETLLPTGLADPEVGLEWVVSTLWPLVLVDWAVSLQFVHILDFLVQRNEARPDSPVLSLQVIARVDNLIKDRELESLLLGNLFPFSLIDLFSDFAYLMLELILKLNLPLRPLQDWLDLLVVGFFAWVDFAGRAVEDEALFLEYTL